MYEFIIKLFIKYFNIIYMMEYLNFKLLKNKFRLEISLNGNVFRMFLVVCIIRVI